MNTKSVGSEGITRRMRWIARIWSALIIAYAVLMLGGYIWNLITLGTADPYAVEDVSFFESLPPILMFISGLMLALAFRWERWGGWMALVLLLAIVVILLIQNPTFEGFPRTAFPYLLVLVIAIPAILFLLCWKRSSESSV
ncbi:MAG: hypothetical protein JXA97_14250 [Anaerolineales bacterium]|nr:hypothetical protein [Anaerolineales bacterium]